VVDPDAGHEHLVGRVLGLLDPAPRRAVSPVARRPLITTAAAATSWGTSSSAALADDPNAGTSTGHRPATIAMKRALR